MEPGHEDREYMMSPRSSPWEVPPQWSPVMKTGNTPLHRRPRHPGQHGLNGARS